MRFSAVTIVACMFAASVVALPVGRDQVVPGEEENCTAGIDGMIADSACYRKRAEQMLKRQQCETNVAGVIEDSACYKKREEEEKAKRQEQCERPPGNKVAIPDSACY